MDGVWRFIYLFWWGPMFYNPCLLMLLFCLSWELSLQPTCKCFVSAGCG